MTFTIPTAFAVLGANDDETGAAQISFGRSVGGAATADGQDEALALLRNGTYSWTTLNRVQSTALATWGLASPQAAWAETTSATYVAVAEAAHQLGNNRGATTVLVDYTGRVKVEAYDSGGSLLASVESSSTAAQSQESLALSWSIDYDGYLKVYLHKGGAVTGYLFGLAVLEDASNSDADATHGFKKIDDDAVAALDPADAYTLQRIARNVEAGYTGRLRRTGTMWPSGNRPVLASARLVAWRLGTWHLSDGADEVKLVVRGHCTDASVKLALVALDMFGSGELDRNSISFTTVSTGAGAANTTLTFDASRFGGRDFELFLLAQSSDGSSAGTKSYTGSNVIDNLAGHLIDLGAGHGITLTAGKRWKVDVSDPSGVNLGGAVGFPEPRTVVYLDGTDDLYVWPRYPTVQIGTNEWSLGTYQVEVIELGKIEVYSMHLFESSTRPRSSLVLRLHAGHLPSARDAYKPLYVRQRRLFKGRTRLHHCLGGFDPARKTGSTTRLLFGAIEPFDDTGWKDMGACLIRGYDPSLDSAGATQYRSTVRVAGLVAVASRQIPHTLAVQLRATLSSFSGGSWGGSVVTSGTTTARCQVLHAFGGDPSLTETGDLIAYNWGSGPNRNAYHFLRGAVSVADLVAGRHGLVPFEIVVKDTQTTANPRLLRLQMQGDDEDVDGHPIDTSDRGHSVWVAGFSCWTHETIVND